MKTSSQESAEKVTKDCSESQEKEIQTDTAEASKAQECCQNFAVIIVNSTTQDSQHNTESTPSNEITQKESQSNLLQDTFIRGSLTLRQTSESEIN